MKRLDTDTIVGLLIHPSLPTSAHDDILGHLQSAARSRLGTACKRMKVKPVDLLDDNRACTFNLALQGSKETTARERHAGLLLRWCVYAREQGMNEIAKARIIAALREFDADDAKHGKVMQDNRTKRTVGPVRLAIRAVLKIHPDYDPDQVWEALSKKPPKGIRFIRKGERMPSTKSPRFWPGESVTPLPGLTSYIETDGQPPTHFPRFRTSVSDEKELLK